MKADMTQVVDRAVREAMQRNRELIAEIVNRLAVESGVTVHGVRHVNAARLMELLTTTEEKAT